MLQKKILLFLPMVVAVAFGQTNGGIGYYGSSNVRDQTPIYHPPSHVQLRPIPLPERPKPVIGPAVNAAPAAPVVPVAPTHAPLLQPNPEPSRPPYKPGPRLVITPRPISLEGAGALEVLQPEPVSEPKPIPQPEPVQEPKPVLKPEPIPQPELSVEPSLVPVFEPIPQLEPVSKPKPVRKPKPIPEPAPVQKPKLVLEPEPIPQPELSVEPSLVPVFEPIPQLEPVRKPEPILQPEPIAEPEIVREAEPNPQPEPIAEPDPTLEPEPIPQTEPVPEPKPIPQPAPIAEPKPILEPKPIPQPKPIEEEMFPITEREPLPEPQLVPIPVVELAPQPIHNLAAIAPVAPTAPAADTHRLGALLPLLPKRKPIRKPAYGRPPIPATPPMIYYPTPSYPQPTIATQATPIEINKPPQPTVARPIRIMKSDFQCIEENGYYSVENECDTYIKCTQDRAIKHSCPDGLHFNPAAKHYEYPCAYPSEVQCIAGAEKQNPKPTDKCPNQYGFYSINDGDCSKYIMCQDGFASIMNCPKGLAFNPQISSCDWPANVPQCNPDAFKDFTCPEPPKDDDGQVSDIIYKYRYEGHCKQYVACQRGHPRLLSCDPGLSFDETSQSCIDEDYVTNCAIPHNVA